MAVCVREVSESRSQESQRCGVPSFWRQDEQRHEILRTLIGRQSCGVDATLGSFRNAPSRIRLPPTIFQVVTVEVNCAVKIGTGPPVRRLAAPCMAGDGAGRKIDATAMGVVTRHI